MVHSRAIGLASLLLALVIGLPLTLGACGGDDENKAATEVTEKDFDVNNFGEDSATIDNKYTPLVPGIQYVYEGESNCGQGRRKHQVIFTATDLYKGDQRRPCPRDVGPGHQRRRARGRARDLCPGQGRKRLEHGRVPGRVRGRQVRWCPRHVAGGCRRGRSAGSARQPQGGTPPYKHGVAPKIGFGDVAKVSKTGQKNCVPTAATRTLVTDETNPLEPQDGQPAQVLRAERGQHTRRARQGRQEREVLVLVKVKKLSRPSLLRPAARRSSSTSALYEAAKRVWGETCQS